MREYILPIIALAFLTAICECFLPRGNMRRFVTPFLGLAVSAITLLPLFSALGDPQKLEAVLPAAEAMLESDVYRDSVETEYTRRIQAEIAARGADAEIVLGENFSVERVILTGEVPGEALHYIQFTLEVPRSHVEIR